MGDNIFWADKAAEEIIEKEEKLKRVKSYRTEMGIGASGIPHIGSVGDGVRSFVVHLALKERGAKSEFIAFSDDRDGLRKVPSGFPDILEKEIGIPVSHIPDPFGCHKSYAEHMSSLLMDAYEKLGIDFVFRSADKEYAKGTLDKEIVDILKNWKMAGEIIKKLTGQEKFELQLPFLPICSQCGNVCTTRAVSFDGKKVTYKCDVEYEGKNSGTGKKILVKGCGFEGTEGIREGKLAWKVDFAARWRALKINYEAYGKDISDSVRVNDAICKEILQWEPPVHSFYELFTERGGEKISKSSGNVFTPQLWLKYASPESMKLVYLKKLGKSRVIDLDAIPAYEEEVDELAGIYFGKKLIENKTDLAHARRLFEFIHFLKPPKKFQPIVQYSTIINIARPVPEFSVVWKEMEKTGHIGGNKKVLEERIGRVIEWIKDTGGEVEVASVPENQKAFLQKLASELGKDWTEEKLQNRIFELSKESGNPREFFRSAYMSITGKEAGPKLSTLILALGKDKIAEKLRGI
ncbi:MAG: lysine--tRNA ligase [Candidatus Aenigmarchaeota archaeon]|nr:lysine--tRNA ligase [Candidatus Aenigmarchaeota archaeon]